MVSGLSDNRLTMVPAVGLYAATANESRMLGKVGVMASNITRAPLVRAGERPLGEWRASDTELHAVCDHDDRGPRSGVESDYESTCVAVGRHRMLLTETALLGAVEGRTVWGDSGRKKAGRLLVWKWDLADIDEIRVHRLKKAFKLWDVGLTISCAGPEARLSYSALGDGAAPFGAIDKTAKAASVDGSDLLGFANAVAAAATADGGREVERTERQDGTDYLYVFRFSPADNARARGTPSPAVDVRTPGGSVPGETDGMAQGEGGGPHGSGDPAMRPEKVPATPGTPEPAPSGGSCTQCGTPVCEPSRFCGACGASTTAEPAASTSTPPEQLPTPPPGPDSSPPLKGVRSTPRPLSRGALVFVAGLVGIAGVAAAYLLTRSAETPADRLTAEGIGPLRIGMTVDEALATGWVRVDASVPFATRDSCGYATVTDEAAVDPEDLSVLFLDGELSLISASGDSVVVGPGDLRIGNHESDVRDAFGDRVEGQRTPDGSTQLEVIEGSRGMSFALSGGDVQAGGPIVSSVKAGSTAALSLIEGCA